jgi:hypothetical protein
MRIKKRMCARWGGQGSGEAVFEGNEREGDEDRMYRENKEGACGRERGRA